MTNISDFMIGRENYLNNIKKDNENTIKEMNILLNDPKIKEYLSLKEKIEKQKEQIHEKDKEYIKKYQEECYHPMYIMIANKNYGNVDDEIYCAVCGKKIIKPLEKKFTWLKELYENKQILAKYVGIGERTNLPRFMPLDNFIYGSDFSKDSDYNPLESIRNEYKKTYLSVNDKENAEDILFDIYCGEEYKRYKKDKTLKKIC